MLPVCFVIDSEGIQRKENPTHGILLTYIIWWGRSCSLGPQHKSLSTEVMGISHSCYWSSFSAVTNIRQPEKHTLSVQVNEIFLTIEYCWDSEFWILLQKNRHFGEKYALLVCRPFCPYVLNSTHLVLLLAKAPSNKEHQVLGNSILISIQNLTCGEPLASVNASIRFSLLTYFQ